MNEYETRLHRDDVRVVLGALDDTIESLSPEEAEALERLSREVVYTVNPDRPWRRRVGVD